MASVIVFDLNETLLDLSAVDPLFEHADRHQLPQARPCGCLTVLGGVSAASSSESREDEGAARQSGCFQDPASG